MPFESPASEANQPDYQRLLEGENEQLTMVFDILMPTQRLRHVIHENNRLVDCRTAVQLLEAARSVSNATTRYTSWEADMPLREAHAYSEAERVENTSSTSVGKLSKMGEAGRLRVCESSLSELQERGREDDLRAVEVCTADMLVMRLEMIGGLKVPDSRSDACPQCARRKASVVDSKIEHSDFGCTGILDSRRVLTAPAHQSQSDCSDMQWKPLDGLVASIATN